eukprot:15333489-Ditylum_brightwellii.AAC.1
MPLSRRELARSSRKQDANRSQSTRKKLMSLTSLRTYCSEVTEMTVTSAAATGSSLLEAEKEAAM